MDLSRADIRRQLDLEAESRSLGIARYERSRPMPWRATTASGVEEEANLPPGQTLLRQAIEPTAAAIRDFVKRAQEGAAGRRHSAVKWLELASAEEVAYITARTVLNYSAFQATLQAAALAVATAIIDHVDMVTLKGLNPGRYSGLVKRSRFSRGTERRLALVRSYLADEEAKTSISRAEKLHLGMAAIEQLIDATGLFTLEQRGRMGTYTIRPTEALSRWLSEQHERSALMAPMNLPMVVRPRRWRNLRAGGYLTPSPGRGLIRSARGAEFAGYAEALANADLSKVYEAVNHIQETPWRINRRVLDVMRQAWEEGGIIAGLPPRDDFPPPAKPLDFETNEESKKDWKRKATDVHNQNAQLFSQRLALQQRLWVADRFVDEPAIWFPHALDFRGRAYPLPANGIQPQGDDGSRALLEFAHGLPLGRAGVYWLAVHIANLFGVDKVSFTERVDWTYAHAPQLIDSALAPLDGDRFWTTADSPWMALAAIFDFAAYLTHGEAYVSHLPIPLDGSNSGLQHFSALLRDPSGAAAVNLVPSDRPSDVYAEVARIALERVLADRDDPRAKWWVGKINRKIAKRPTMTYVYSATRYGTQDMILQTLKELDAAGDGPYLDGADNYEAANYLSYIMFDAIAEVVSSATRAMDWLRSVARVASNADAPLRWTAPDGLIVQQAYRQPVGKRVEVHWRGAKLMLTLVTDSATIANREQANGIAPNFIHSLDAAHLRALARAAKGEGIDYLGVVHDSFATHAARTDDLARLLRETFVEQYEPDLLAQFRDEIAAALPPEWGAAVPAPPDPGELDLADVRHSSYLFA